MNLHAIAGPVVAAINPTILCQVQFSNGSTTGADGTEVPAYSAPVTMTAQVQAFAQRDLRQVEGLNLQGTYRAIYLYGDVEGVVRVTAQGGDLITFPGPVAGFAPGSVWLTAYADETWADVGTGWCRVIAVLQDGS